MGRRNGLVAVLLSGSLLLACDADDEDSGTTGDGTAGTTAPAVSGQAGPTAPAPTAELVLEFSGDVLTARYAGRLAAQRWRFAEVYRNNDEGPSIQVGYLMMNGDTGTFEPYHGRPIVRREGMTHGGPGPETYPLDLAPGEFQVCSEVVPRAEMNEAVCASFTIPE